MPISHYDNLISVQILTKEVLHANKYGIKNDLNFSPTFISYYWNKHFLQLIT